MRDIEPLMTGILSAAASSLNAAGVTPGLVHLSPGNLPAYDNCCEGGGQLWLRLKETYPSAGIGAAFPQIDTAQKGAAGGACSVHALALNLGLGVMRCAHTIDSNGVPPTAAEMTGDALATYDDLGLLLDVIVCDVPTLAPAMTVKVDRWTPQGVQGGCVGGEWGFYVGFDPCVCQNRPEATP